MNKAAFQLLLAKEPLYCADRLESSRGQQETEEKLSTPISGISKKQGTRSIKPRARAFEWIIIEASSDFLNSYVPEMSAQGGSL